MRSGFGASSCPGHDRNRTRSASGAAGYTRMVSSKQRISAVVVTVLAALHLSGTFCAIVCDSSAPSVTTHHGTDRNCSEDARQSTGVQMQGVSEHDCGNHEVAFSQAATAAVQRTALHAASPHVLAPIGQAMLSSPPPSGAIFEYASPPGSSPPTTRPLVLRV